jgi:hypothetical protein
MIDTTAEALLSLPQAARLIPPGRSGKKTHVSTLLRWLSRGAPGPDGDHVRLEAIRVGQRWMTTRESLQRFFERLTPVDQDVEPLAPPRTATQREKAVDRASRRLEKAGI